MTAKTGSGTESYAYDDNGNRVGATAGSSSSAYVTGLGNRLTDDGTYTHQHDNEGNILKRTLKSNTALTTEYTWDHRNRLTAVTEKNGTTITSQINYTYDAQERRVKRAYDANGGAPSFTNEYFVYDGDDLAMRFEGATGSASVLTHRYLYGPLTDQVLVDEVFTAGTGGQRVSDDVLWQLADHQGTIRDIVADDGTLRKHVEYDSFGAITGESYYGASGNPIPATNSAAVDQLFYYTGQEWDKDAKLQNSNARWYDPRIGRFLSEDPIDADANTYRYAGNDPVNHTDPTGLFQAGNPLNGLFSSLAKSPSPLINNYVPKPSSFGTSPLGFVATVAQYAPAIASGLGGMKIPGGGSLFGNSVETVGQYARLAGSVARNTAELLTTFNPSKVMYRPNQPVLAASDPSIPRLFSAAVDPYRSFTNSVGSEVSRGDAFAALMYSQRFAVEQAYEGGLTQRYDELNSWSSDLSAKSFNERLHLGSEIISSQTRQELLTSSAQYNGLNGITTDRQIHPGYSIPYGGIDKLVWGLEGVNSPHALESTSSPLDFAAAFGAGILQNSLRASAAVGVAAPRSTVVDKSWKSIIQGKPQPSTTPGHTFRNYREAIEMAKSGQYESVYINRAYSTVTGTTTTPRRLPDVLGKRYTGQFDAVEVPSITDKIDFLRQRNIDAMKQLPANQRGNVLIAPVTRSTP